jgi:hypothetical protein
MESSLELLQQRRLPLTADTEPVEDAVLVGRSSAFERGDELSLGALTVRKQCRRIELRSQVARRDHLHAPRRGAEAILLALKVLSKVEFAGALQGGYEQQYRCYKRSVFQPGRVPINPARTL